MWSMTITDPIVKQTILSHMIDQIDHGRMDELLASGIDPRFIDELRQRRVRDLGFAARSDQLTFEVQFDPVRMKTCFARIDLLRRDQQMMEDFIRAGASCDLLRQLFRMSKSEVGEYRKQLHDAVQVQGRTKQIPERVRDEIHQVWSKMIRDTTASNRDQFYALQQRYPDYHVNSLWLAVREYDELAAERA